MQEIKTSRLIVGVGMRSIKTLP